MPISIRHGTNAGTFYQMLAARLAEVLEETLPVPPADPGSFYRDKVIEYLDLFHEKERRCLVVVDGLDEAAGWQVDASVLPLDPAPGLRIVASARELAGDHGSTGWLRRLGWDAPRARATTVKLPPLDREGIADVIQRMGYPLGPAASQQDFLAELLRLTSGDPLLIQHYATELLQRDDHAMRLRAEELRELRPAIAQVFDTMWAQQQRAWEAESIVVDERTIQALLAVLACALGPLKLVDLAHLVREVGGSDRIFSADTLAPIRRFVVGDGVHVGYMFSHPTLATYFLKQHFGNSEVIKRARAAFIEWGRQTVRAFNAGKLAPSASSDYDYLFRFYSQHLQREGADPEFHTELDGNGWRRAREAYERWLSESAR